MNYTPCIIYGQLMYRFYELMAIPSPNMQQNCQLLNIFSLSSMVMFTQFCYIIFSSCLGHSDKVEFVKIYDGHGEICNIESYWMEHRYMLIISYLLALTLKLFNSYKYAYYEIHIEAKQRNCLTEDIIREKYFDFFWNQLPLSEERSSDLQNCFWCWCKCRSKCCSSSKA